MSKIQPRSDSIGVVRPDAQDELPLVDLPQLSRYDLLLATIPVVLVASWLSAQATAVPVWAALATGAFAVLPLLADGLAVNPPV